MKKYMLLWSTAALALLSSACTKDEAAEPEPKQPVATERLYLSDEATEAKADPQSRAHFADGYKIAWEEGDEVAITDNQTRYPVLQDEAGRWYVELPTADSYTVYYPAASKKVISSGDIFELGSEQTYREGSFDKACFAARAVAKKGEMLTFKYMCSMLKLTLTGSASEAVASIRIDGLADEVLSPGGEIAEDETGAAYITKFTSNYASLSKSYVVLNADPAVALTSEGVDFYMTMIPAKFNHGFTITVTLADGRVMKRVGGIGQSANRGKMLVMPALRFEETPVDNVSPVLYSMDNRNWLSWRYEANGTTPVTLAYPQNANNRLYFKDNEAASGTKGLTLAHFQSLHDTFMTDGMVNGNSYTTVVAVNPIGFDFSQATYESDILPSNIFTRNGEAANQYNINMRYISLPKNIREIADNALCWNLVLHTVILPQSVEKIGALVFEVSRGLHSTGDSPDPETQGVFCYATTPPSFGANAFNWNNGNFHIPAASLSAYEAVWASDPLGARLARMTLVGDL